MLLIGAGWWYARTQLGPLAMRLIREQAGKSINGRLEFSSLKVDALGRAELTDVQIIPEGKEAALISCDKVLAAVDLFTLFGVNRGARAIVLTLNKPRLSVLREMDGRIGMASLFKQQPPKKTDWGMSVQLVDAQIEFTDLCLLDSPYPVLEQQDAFVEKLLAEAGYSRSGPGEAEVFEALLNVNGSLAYNPPRSLMQLDLNATLENGEKLSASGSGAADGSDYRITLGAQKLPLSRVRGYLQALLPALVVEDQAGTAARPALAGSIGELSLVLSKEKGQVEKVDGSIELAGLRYRSRLLPQLDFPRLLLAYDAKSEQLSSQLELLALGAKLSGKPSLGLKDHSLGGRLQLSADSLGALAGAAGLKAFPLSGGLSASAELGGSLDTPEITLKAGSDMLSFDNGQSRRFKLGKLALEAALKGRGVDIRQARFSGGELPFSISGKLALDGAGKIELDAGPLAAGSLLSLLREFGQQGGAEDSLRALADASGKLSLKASLDIPASKAGSANDPKKLMAALSGKASLSSTALALKLASGAELKLGKAAVSGSFSRERFSIDSAQFSGGDLPLSASGRFVFASRNGEFSLSAGPLEVSDALALSRELSAKAGGRKQSVPKAISEARGQITAGAELKIASGRATGSLSLGSEKLSIAGLSISGLSALGSLKGQTIDLDSAEGKVTLAEAFEAATFRSSGPLALSVRVGGSIGLPDENGKGGSLNLSGKAATLNLAPQQANLSYKLGGALSAPDLKLQAKTDAKENPLLVSISSKLSEGNMPLTASLSWYGSQADYSGKLDLGKRTLEGKLTADKVEIGRFSPDRNLSGTLSLNATLSGSLDALSASGRASLPRLSYKVSDHSYDITEASFGFKLSQTPTPRGSPPDGALAVSDGKFRFEGNSFTVGGVLGRGEKKITLASDNFNLFSALALIPEKPAGGKTASQPLDIRSSGPLELTIGGELSDPRFSASYSSGAGSVSGHAFDSASLRASGNLKGVVIESFTVKSKDGSISASASLDFASAAPKSGSGQRQRAAAAPRGWLARFSQVAQAAVAGDATEVGGVNEQSSLPELKPTQAGSGSNAGENTAVQTGSGSSAGSQASKSELPSGIAAWKAKLSLDSFDAAVLTPLSGVPALSALKGRVDGAASLSGTDRSFSADGELSLSGGSYNGVPITAANARFRTKGKAVEIESATLSNDKTSLSVSGTVGPEPKDLALKVRAEKLDLALLVPLMPKDAPKVAGVITADMSIKPGKGAYPDLDLTLKDTGGGLKVGAASFSAASADLTLSNDVLNIARLGLSSGGSSLSAGGKLSPALLIPGADGKASGRMPLDFWVKAERFAFADLKPLMPKPAPGEKAFEMPDGIVSCELSIGGRLDDPQLSGPLSFTLAGLPMEMPLGIESLSGEVQLTKNNFDIRKMSVASGSDAQLARMAITGSGGIKFEPFGLTPGSSIDINLSPDGRYYQAKKSADLPFEGSLGGRIVLSGASSKDSRQPWVLSGNLSVNEPGNESIYTYREPGGKSEQPASPVRLKNLKVVLNEGTEFRFAPGGAAAKFSDLRAAVQGQITLNGVPGVMSGADALGIDGSLALVSGSMRVYRHVVRLDGNNNKIVFPKQSEISGLTPLAPLLTARGVLTLENVLSGADSATSTNVGMSSGGRSTTNDLIITVGLSEVALSSPEHILDDMKLSSQPPLSQEKILLYLLGGADRVLMGEEDLSQFAEGELVAFGSTFISRAIERSFDLERFSLGGSGDETNPYYVDVEKKVSPDMSFTYFKNFYSQTNQQEQYGMRYKLLEGQAGGKYRNLNLEVNFDKNNNGRQGAEFMFNWTTSF